MGFNLIAIGRVVVSVYSVRSVVDVGWILAYDLMRKYSCMWLGTL